MNEAKSKQVKEAIRQKLKEAIKNLQIKFVEDTMGEPITNMEYSNALCTALEALLVHGVKSSLISNLMRKKEHKQQEENFWHFVMIFTHRATLQKIEKLHLITTDVGKCRAWIRLALNDGLLGSYLESMVKDKNETSRTYYDRTAFIRDQQCMDIVRG